MLRLSRVATARTAYIQSSNHVARMSSQAASKPQSGGQNRDDRNTQQRTDSADKQQETPKKTLAQMDEEMRRAMEGLAGDGGEAGLELEDGKAVSMKRGVRENMFRYI